MKLKRLLFGVVLLLSGASVFAQVEEVAKLESACRDALDILYEAEYKDYSKEEKLTDVRTILERNYDLMVLIRRAIGRNWKLLSPPEQSKIKELVAQLIVKAFVEGLAGVERPTIQYGEMVTITEKRIEIPTVVTFADGRMFNLVYRLGRLKTGWQIYDIIVEEVSVVSNYRQQIDDHFRKGTGAELIEKLEQLLEEEDLSESYEF